MPWWRLYQLVVCINKITNYLSFVLWDMLGVGHCAWQGACEQFGLT